MDVVVIGPPGVGKTSLIQALTGLSKELQPTIGPEVFALSRDGTIVHLWDTPGQARYASVSSGLAENARLVLSCSSDGKFADPPKGAQLLRVRTKDDLNLPWFPADLATSAVSGSGVRALFDAIFSLVGAPPSVGGGCCCGGFSAGVSHKYSESNSYSLDFELHPMR